MRIALLAAEMAAPVTGPFEIRDGLGYSGLGLVCHQTIMQFRGRWALGKAGNCYWGGTIPAADLNVKSVRALCFCPTEWFYLKFLVGAF